MNLAHLLHIRLSTLSAKTEEGQTLVEYGLILALISVVAIAALGAMGTGVINTLHTVTAKL
jgi:Flp pilus assembly pilin Flp